MAPSLELAYLVGLVLGDGWIEHKKVAKGYYVGVASTKKELPELFRDTCVKIFGKSYAISLVKCNGELQYRCVVGSKELYELIREGREDIYNIVDYIAPYPNAFIRGFADAEGCVTFYKAKRGIIAQIEISNANKDLLLFIKNLLSQMNIYASMRKIAKKGDTYKTPSGIYVLKKDIYDLVITRQQDVIRYSELIGFNHPEKRKKLEEAVRFIKSWQEKLAMNKFNRKSRESRDGAE